MDWRAADPTRWIVKRDSSAGWEVVSPVLRDAEGFLELQRACDGLTELVAGSPNLLRLDHRCGLHLTLATKLDTDERLRGLLKRVQRLEPALFTLTSPSRLYPFCQLQRRYSKREGNPYCRPVRRLRNVDRLGLTEFMQNDRNRYYTVNLTRQDPGVQLLEVRMHGGTTEFRKMALWTSLWMQIFNRSRYEWSGRGRCGPIFRLRDRPVGPRTASRVDIIKVLGAEGIPLTPEFVRLLRERRRELREPWGRLLPARVASWDRAGWYD